MNIVFWKWWLVVNIGIAMVALGEYYFNSISYIYQTDTTGISVAITAVAVAFVVSLLFVWKNIKKSANHIYWFASDAVLSLGMVGTLAGFLMVLGQAFADINPQDIASMTAAIEALARGMATALITSLCGLVVSIWLKLQIIILEDR